MRRSEFSLLTTASETGWLMRSSLQVPDRLRANRWRLETADDSDEIHAVLHGISVSSGFLLNGIGTVGDSSSFRDCMVLGWGFASRTKRVLVKVPIESGVRDLRTLDLTVRVLRTRMRVDADNRSSGCG